MPTIGERIVEKAIEALDAAPEGLRYTDLVRRVMGNSLAAYSIACPVRGEAVGNLHTVDSARRETPRGPARRWLPTLLAASSPFMDRAPDDRHASRGLVQLRVTGSTGREEAAGW
jgi:hypothetical protein